MRRLRQWFRRRACPAPAAPRAQLRVEQLEQRAVPSASTFVDLSGRGDFLRQVAFVSRGRVIFIGRG